MRQSTLLIVNALASFGRMVVTFGMGLVVESLVFNTLGETDYALLVSVGAGGAMLALITQALSFSTQRHLAYEIGRGDQQALGEVFNTVVILFAVMSVAVALLGAVMATPILGYIGVPEGRERAAAWVYTFTVANIVITVCTTPFLSLITARQSLWIASIVGVLRSTLTLGAAVTLLYVSTDPLATYAALLLGANVLTNVAVIGASLWWFAETRPRPGLFRWAQLRAVGAFASWTIVHQLGTQFMQQGAVLLMAGSFGKPTVAAYGVAHRVGQYLQNLTFTLVQVVQPAATGVEARGDRASVHLLVLSLGRYCTLLASMLIVPLMLEAEALLALWLGEYPPMAPTFARLILAWIALLQLTRGYHVAIIAEGNIRTYVLGMTSFAALTLVLGAVEFHLLGWPAWALPATAIGTAGAAAVFQLLYVGKRIGLSPGVWLRRTLAPVVSVIAIAAAAAAMLRQLMPDIGLRVIIIILAYGLLTAALTWTIAMESVERDHFKRVIRAILTRLGIVSS